MRVSGEDLQDLLGGMEESFDYFSLQVLLKTRFNLNISMVTGQLKRGADQIFDVHAYFHARNTVEQLIAALRDARPEVPAFARLADQAGFTLGTARQALEVLVARPDQPYQDVGLFRSELAKREAAVCQVRTANALGTGCLIGDDLVLTNHHVIADVLDGSGALRSTVTCRFDHKASVVGYTTPPVDLQAVAVVSSSPHSPDDLDPSRENADAERLDYALLRLSARLASRPVVDGGSPRGAAPLAGARLPDSHEGLIVLQHPAGRPMKIDIGAVLWTGHTRLRHSVNTEPGSSGAPIFDAALNFVALHHAGFDWPRTGLPHNQAIPMPLILAHARSRGASV